MKWYCDRTCKLILIKIDRFWLSRKKINDKIRWNGSINNSKWFLHQLMRWCRNSVCHNQRKRFAINSENNCKQFSDRLISFTTLQIFKKNYLWLNAPFMLRVYQFPPQLFPKNKLQKIRAVLNSKKTVLI